MITISKKTKIIAAVLAAAIIVIIYGLFDPSSTPFPRCPFLQITGWQCPGCGSQRAIHALLHGNIASAWAFNPALVAAIPVLILMAVASPLKTRFPALYRTLNSKHAAFAWLTLLIAWAIARNLF